MKKLPFSKYDSANIPDCWPGKALRATINESRPVFQGKRVIVTGVCSFMGGHLARALDAAGAKVVGFDHDTSPANGCQLDINGLRDRIEIFQGDITHRAQMEELVLEGEFSHIFHLATSTDNSSNDLANARGLINLAEGARLLPEAKRPVIIYGSTENAPCEANALPHVEEYDLGGGIFDAADTVTATYYKTLKVPTTALRLCDIFGPYDLNFDAHLITGAMRNIFRDGESPEIPMSSIDQFHDFLFVDDAVRAFLHIARSENCLGQTYNLPGTHHSSAPDVLRDIVSSIGDLQDKEHGINPNSLFANHRWNRSIRVVPSEPDWSNVSELRLDGARIEHDTGFVPMTGFKEGLADTARFYSWYFNQSASPAVQPAIVSVGNDQMESRFETVLTDDGLPVYRLTPGKATKTVEDKPRTPKPVSFLTEAYLAI